MIHAVLAAVAVRFGARAMASPAVRILVVVALLAACAPGYAPITHYDRPLCTPRAVAFQTPFDDAIASAFGRVRTVALPDAPAGFRDVAVVVARGIDTNVAVCGRGGMVTMMVDYDSIDWIAASGHLREFVAWFTAHEFGHLVLMHVHSSGTAPETEEERAADRLGAYYFAKAGFSCDWLALVGRQPFETDVWWTRDARADVMKVCRATNAGGPRPAAVTGH